MSNKSAYAAFTAMVLGMAVCGLSLPSFAAKSLHVRTLGTVDIKGESASFRIMIDGKEAARDNLSEFVSIVRAYPDDIAPRWVLISHDPGGNSCDSSYSIVDLTKSPSMISRQFGNCRTITEIEGIDKGEVSQVVYSLGGLEVWAFDDKGLVEVPKLPLDEHVRIGVDAFKAGNYAQALRHLWPFTNQQNPEAAYYMGLMTHLGKGVAQDYNATMAYYKQAADLEYPQAFFRIGVLHANGRGVPKNMAEANSWYRKAADRGDGLGMFNLGLNLMTGTGAAKDPRAALMWFLLAEPRMNETKDRESAKKNIAFLESKLTPAEASEARTQAAAWKPVEAKIFETAADLLVWVGKHPLDKIKGRTLFQIPSLDVRLRLLLGDEIVGAIHEFGVSSSVREVRDWILVAGCKPHGCGTDQYSLAIDSKTFDLLACVLRSSKKGSGLDAVWAGTNRPTVEQSSIALNNMSLIGDCTVERGPYTIMAVLDSAKPRSAPAASRQAQVASAAPPSPPRMEERSSSGSGFPVNAMGDILTNHHVVEGCRTLKARRGERLIDAELVATDEKNDLAVMRAAVTGIQPLKFRDGKGIRPADGVVAVGYPYAGLLATTAQVTTGSVTALAGIADDTRFLQITAPIQPGNSGGPLLDLSGNTIGVVVSTLSALAVVKATGSIPQNVNFAIKSSVAREFLDSKGINYETATSMIKLDPADVGEIGSKSAIMIECYK